MQLWEGIRLAMTQIVTERLKSFFSLIGVIIGVMFLIVVVSVVEGMDRYIREDFSSELFGINTVTVRRSPAIDIEIDEDVQREQRRRPRITWADSELIRQKLRTPARVGVESGVGGTVVGDNGIEVENVDVTAVSAEMFQIRDWVTERGRPFSPQEARQGVPVVVLGSGTAEAIFGSTDPLGRQVRVNGFPFRIVGVLEEQGSLFGQSLDNKLIAPLFSPIRSNFGPRSAVSSVIIQAIDQNQIRQVQTEIEGILRVDRRLRPSEPSNFEVETAGEALSIWDTISRVLFTALPALVGISLVVGGIVIMNIMLVSVMERTREIGVRKAIGARRSDILFQVLVEATTLSFVGAVIGVAAGISLTGLVASLTPLPAAVAPQWVALGVLLGMMVGIGAGVYPAAQASKLDPVDALRYE